jgi:hypothetical protein
MKAIDTVYRGYNFRSRLEARWAVFFDTAKLTWTYEEEGYQLPSGWYLPDFRILEFDMFIEIKPVDFNAKDKTSREYILCQELAMTTGKAVCLNAGEPFGVKGFSITPTASSARAIDLLKAHFENTSYSAAATAARQARFEHGHSGA